MMKKQITEKIYIALFFLMLISPFVMINRDQDAISEQENRPLTTRPEIIKSSGFNKNITADIESYLDDRVGFRDQLISANALMQYHIFSRMENGSRYRLGPEGEFHIIENDMIETYQHLNLFSENKLDKYTESFQTLSDYLKDRDCEFYYMQCWDKQSIYPEYFPKSVIQYGDISRTDQIITSLEERTDINLIPLKNIFIDNKTDYEVYSKYGDPVHWTERGAFIGYTELMSKLNETHDFHTLTEDDFNITTMDQGMSFYGGVKRSNYSEHFERKESNAVLDEDYGAEHKAFDGVTIYHYTNELAGNDTKVMIVGNSFIVNYLMEDLAESFGDMLMVWEDIDPEFISWVEEYDPDIVIFEMVERYAAYSKLKKTADSILEMK